MADLIAQGPEFSQRWRRELPVGRAVTIGRQAGPWSIAWDDRVSRQHVQVAWDGNHAAVEVLPAARNPVFYRGRAVERFQIQSGEHFVVGNTTLTVSADRALVTLDSPQPSREQTFSAARLKQLAFRNAQQRIEILSQLSGVIEGAASERELFSRLINLLLSGVPHADAAALVRIDADSPAVAEVLHWDRRRMAGGDFQPSQRLIHKAVFTQESVLHTWLAEKEASEFTAAGSVDWAFCTPLLGAASKGWALYVAGRFAVITPTSGGVSDPEQLQDDVKFAEIVGSMLASLRELRHMQRRQAGFSQFFSPPVLELLETGEPEQVLAPQEVDVTVLFCDLRGFSRTSEQSSEQLMELLSRVGEALGVMTRQILHHGGVVGDFHGDAAMGFWGWPIATNDSAELAARAALAIREQFESASGVAKHPLSGFRVGIGIATGRAVAGRIGSADQVKVTVFGPVVNLAARLESMTRTLGAPILTDERTALLLSGRLPRETGRLRRFVVVQPFGLTSRTPLYELLGPATAAGAPDDRDIEAYESAVDSFVRGRWLAAIEQLRSLSHSDHAVQFLTETIERHRGVPPADWDGTLVMQSK